MKRDILYLLLLIGLTGCSDHPDDGKPVESEDKVQLIFVPENEPLATRSGDAGVSESIDNLEILVFEAIEDDLFTYTYRTTAEETDTKNKYNVTLRLSDVAVKLLLIANHTDFQELTFGYTIEDAIGSLLIPFTPAGINKIPMYGEISFPDGLTSREVEIEENIPLLRSVAAVEISLEDQLYGDRTFILKSVQTYRANDLIQVIPNGSAFPQEKGETWKVTSPSIPADAESTITTQRVGAGDEPVQMLGPVFLPESEKKEGIAITPEATCLIVGGVYRGSGYATNEDISYYRIDFKSENGSVTGQILRNYKYNILITEVKGPGTTHPEEADEYNIGSVITEWYNSNHTIDDLGKTN